MKREKISTALNDMDSVYIEEATAYQKKTDARRVLLRWGSMAASFVILLLAGVFFLQPLFSGDPAVRWDDPEQILSEDGVLEKRKIAVIHDSRYADYTSLRAIDAAYVGEKLGDTEIKSFWRNYLLKEDTDTEFLRAEIYEIKGVAPDVAVCIRYLDKGDALTTDHYYTYINTAHSMRNFEELYQLFTLDAEMSARTGLTLSYPSAKGTVRSHCTVKAEILENAIASVANADTALYALTDDGGFPKLEKEILKDCTAHATFYGEMPLAGVVSFRIYDNGYLLIQKEFTVTYIFEIPETVSAEIFNALNTHKVENAEPDRATVTHESESQAVRSE